MKIKITDNRQEMSKIGRSLARLTRADITSDKYKDYRDDMEILYPKFGGVENRRKTRFMRGYMTSGYMESMSVKSISTISRIRRMRKSQGI